MAVDYDKLAATAKRLIAENGRDIILERIITTPADATKPWKGNNGVPGTPYETRGVFAPPAAVRQFGLPSLGQGTEFQDFMSFSEQVCILFPDTNDLRDYVKVREADPGSPKWGIVGYQLLRPAEVSVLAFLGLRR